MTDRLGNIISKTLLAIETGKEEIFHIAETSRTETQRLTQELSHLRVEISETIKKVDQLQKEDRKMRQHLMEVSRDYTKYNEKIMIETYAKAKDTQVQLQLAEAKESQLRTRRNEIERSLRRMMDTIERAENLISQVTLAINLLHSGISEMTQDQNFEKRQEIALRISMAQEEERRRVAREIHDGPAQNLANIVLRLEIAEKLLELDPKQAKNELQDLKVLVRANLQDIRRIIFDLRPMALDDLGIVPALRRFMDNFQATYNIQCEFQITGREKRLLPAMEVAVFRLIQEAMTNVAKHAHSEHVKIELIFKDDITLARIIDFGQGFNVDQALDNPGDHFGLIGMKERVEMFSGQFSIISPSGVGTTVEMTIPSKKEEDIE
ncbi:sensor histidine kinase [Desulfitobacterium sp.]|uniref:sensor histidine kinase n=1 Tax=Desulfitobacterium sp. TaxID=49981 RepID=UPI002C150AF9|nr:sensor histidine kinase [Desulfitobacterium sp.]HVJ48601.1 sensor histidine kinase [Desulfitobacterium sp.]